MRIIKLNAHLHAILKEKYSRYFVHLHIDFKRFQFPRQMFDNCSSIFGRFRAISSNWLVDFKHCTRMRIDGIHQSNSSIYPRNTIARLDQSEQGLLALISRRSVQFLPLFSRERYFVQSQKLRISLMFVQVSRQRYNRAKLYTIICNRIAFLNRL